MALIDSPEHMHAQDAFGCLPSLDDGSSTSWGPEFFPENRGEPGSPTVANSPSRYENLASISGDEFLDLDLLDAQARQNRSQSEELTISSLPQRQQKQNSALRSEEGRWPKGPASAGSNDKQVYLGSEPRAKAGSTTEEDDKPHTTRFAQRRRKQSRGKRTEALHTTSRPVGVQKKRLETSKGAASALQMKLEKVTKEYLERLQ